MEPTAVLTTALSDRYRIEAEIDSGGMATVYRARDLKHERTVAIKVLRPDLGEAIGQDRFLKEIRTTANLSHPHILPLFDSGEAAGLLYYVMPFVEGESLADRLEREGQLPVEDAVQVAREVAEALDYAHEKGVIHRDIKPANIMLERGHALLADFGIAQAKAGADETRLTGMGMSLGTPAYMSPEQISGEGTVDGRSDQYALACVLYEMLAGHPPFTGSDIQTVMRQHLAAEAPKVTGARARVPTGVAKAIHRGLDKTPADRYRTVAEFEKALAGATLPLLARIPMGRARAAAFLAAVVLVVAAVGLLAIKIRAPAPSSTANGSQPALIRNRVLVTLFENDTDDPSVDRIGLEATDEIIQELGRLGVGLVEVLPMETARSLGAGAGCGIAVRQRAGTLISGAVFPEGDRLRISTQILDVEACRVLWRLDPVVTPVEDVNQAFSELADRVGGAVAGHLDSEGSWLEMGRPPPPSFDVYLEYKASLEAPDFERKVEHLERALALDSTYLTPRLELSVAYMMRGFPALADYQATISQRYRDRGTPGEQAQIDYYQAGARGDREGAYLYSRRMADLSGASFDLAAHAHEAKQTNRPREVSEILSSLNPDDPDLRDFYLYWSDLSEAHHMLGEYEAALTVAREGQERFPGRTDLILDEARALSALGRVQEVLAVAEEVEGRFWPSEDLTRIGGYLLHDGHEEAAQGLLAHVVTLVEEMPEERRENFGGWVVRGDALLLMDRLEEAREFLERAVAERPHVPGALVSLGITAARQGEVAEARNLADRIRDVDLPYDLGRKEHFQAWIAAALGDLEGAVELLGEAYADGMPFDADLWASPWLDPVRGHPSFEGWLRPKG